MIELKDYHKMNTTGSCEAVRGIDSSVQPLQAIPPSVGGRSAAGSSQHPGPAARV